MELKEQLAKKAELIKEPEKVKLTKSMDIADLIKAMQPEIKRALPQVITPERFTRIALSALNTTPKLKECTPMSFLAALMAVAQLGLEVNSVLNHAYLIPYNNKGKYEVQLVVGYRGILELAYRNPNMKMITAEVVYENDEFSYELGLNPILIHKPAFEDRGEIKFFYGVYKTGNGGYGFSVMTKNEMDQHAQRYSKAYDAASSPWKNNYVEMGLKTILKRTLRYLPLHAEVSRALATDGMIKNEISSDMSEVQGEIVFEADYVEQST